MTHLFACLGSGNCYKPWLLMNQTGQSFKLSLIDVLKSEQKEQAYLDVNPLGVVPYLQTPDGTGIGESNAMLWFLAEGTHLMPKTATGRAQALQWMFFEQSRLEPFISPARFFTTILPHERRERAADIDAWQSQAKPGLDRLNAHLAQQAFVLECGYSIADIAVFGYVHVLEEAGLLLSDFPNIARWIKAVGDTEGFVALCDLGQAKEKAA